MDNYCPEDFEAERYDYITLDGDESEPDKKIFVPLETKVLGKKHSFLVPSLLEIALKAAHRYHRNGKIYLTLGHVMIVTACHYMSQHDYNLMTHCVLFKQTNIIFLDVFYLNYEKLFIFKEISRKKYI